MKHWSQTLSISLIGLSLLITGMAIQQPARSQDNLPGADAQEGLAPAIAQTPRKVIYLFSTDFPPSALAQAPSPPMAETRFWQLMDKEMQATQDLSLTENMEEADYRVELRCAGIAHCAKLVVNVRNMQRDVLTTFVIKDVLPFWGMLNGTPNLELVSHQLTQRLDERLKLLNQGGYGYIE